MTVALPRTPSFRLDGKRALVTGAGRGIGVAAAAALAEAGAEMVLVARSGQEVEAVAAAIRSEGGKASAQALDVTDLAATARLIDAAGPFHLLVSNAGTNRLATFEEVSVEDFDAVFLLNVKAAFFAAQAVARGLIAAGEPGSIIHISSQMGKLGGPRRSVYCATKHAIEGLTKASAIDLAPHRIRVNTICPTFIDTPLARPILADEAFRAIVMSRIKLGRIGHVEDLMGAVLYLASDASALVTGTALMVDGGWTAG